MKTILFIFLFISLHAKTNAFDLKEIRATYNLATQDKQKCLELIHALEKINETKPGIITGYIACCMMVKAKFLFNPIEKLNSFMSGKKLLERCIASNERHTELRYLRYTIQTNVPAFLGYHNDLQRDKLFLMDELKKLEDVELKQMITKYLASEKAKG